eukprot:TRINITY_DN4890_c0_g1_i2.p1 TRINITY_DN4890_c0_g1~~TRINITY_DN4890_c0_g1_i2.p1  ORF type:complete len:202 (-),score=24.72 TRINITY_DN4890_c0_g1_i2:204-809(-)
MGYPVRNDYTQEVVTMWYRAPELLIGLGEYDKSIDMWSVGVIFGELLTNDPLFKGRNEIDHLDKMFRVLGSPNSWDALKSSKVTFSFNSRLQPTLRKRLGTALTETGYDLLERLLEYDPKKRISAKEALKHPYFTERPHPRDPALIQTRPSLHEGKTVPKKSVQNDHIFGDRMDHIELEQELLGDSNDPWSKRATGFRLKF